MIKSLYKGFNFGDFDTTNFFDKSTEHNTAEMESDFYEVIKDIKGEHDGGVVLDIGASTGVISWLALKSNPDLKHIYMVEPNPPYVELIKENFRNVDNWTLTEKIISDKEGETELQWDDLNTILPCTTFQKVVEDIPRVDLLKVDIEGGEYDIFTEENLYYLTHCVGDMVIEFHTYSQEHKDKFRNLRDNYIPKLMFNKTIDVFSLDNLSQNWDYWNEHFIEYYNCFMMVFKENK
tara:strand:+ start:938 stop:1642 length:705 start_codon:yes stop_codon:yes gene_type:complete